MKHAVMASSGSVASAGKSQSSGSRNPQCNPTVTASEEVDDDWTPRMHHVEQQQPLLLQNQLKVLRLQQEELDFEAGVAEDRRSNLSAISKDAAQVIVTSHVSHDEFESTLAIDVLF
jgi:hypothetical protein